MMKMEGLDQKGHPKKNVLFKLEMAVLAALNHQDCYGYEVSEIIRDHTRNLFNLREGVLYPILYQLSAQGMISSCSRIVNGRNRIYYHLEEPGRIYLRKLYEEYLEGQKLLNDYLIWAGCTTQKQAENRSVLEAPETHSPLSREDDPLENGTGIVREPDEDQQWQWDLLLDFPTTGHQTRTRKKGTALKTESVSKAKTQPSFQPKEADPASPKPGSQIPARQAKSTGQPAKKQSHPAQEARNPAQSQYNPARTKDALCKAESQSAKIVQESDSASIPSASPAMFHAKSALTGNEEPEKKKEGRKRRYAPIKKIPEVSDLVDQESALLFIQKIDAMMEDLAANKSDIPTMKPKGS